MSQPSAVESIFFAALERPSPADRTSYLEEACQADPDLRRQVEKLLKAHSRLGAFLQKPAVDHATAVLADLEATQSFDMVADTKKSSETAGDDPAQGPTEGGADVDYGRVLDFLEPSSRPDSLGRLGHYEILQLLGQGGFGSVFRAFDESLQRMVAVKVLSPRLAETSPPRKRFLREARSSAKVRHVNIVQVFAVEEQPLPYLVMEFVPGETLQQRLNRTGPLETAEVIRIGRQIAEGLAAAHAEGLIHRDIKPANILIESGANACAKITDFGLARAADDASLSHSGVIAGTPMYMSPEQVRGDKLDPRADLFSLGSVLYAMCSGRPPFRADNTLAVLKRVAEDRPRPIPEIIPETPAWLCDLIARLHAKHPEGRIGTAREVADLLTAGKNQPVLAATPPGSAAPLRRPFPGNRWIAAVVGLVLLIAGLGFTESNGVTNVRGTIIRLLSPEGTLVVEVDDPGVSVQVDGSELVIKGAGAREIRLKPGKYTVEARKDGKLVRRELVTVTNNGRQVVRVSQEPPAAPKPVSAEPTPWEESLKSLPPEEQVKAVVARLMELNPDFNGQLTPIIEGDAVTGLTFVADRVTDISPVHGLTRLRSLDCFGSDLGQSRLYDLSPLRGLPLTHLNCRYTGVSDLSPLEGMNLQVLDCRHTNVADPDVKSLAGMHNLKWLSLWGTRVTDVGLKELAVLKDLQFLTLESTQVTDAGLRELAGLQRLNHLSLYHNLRVTDAGLKELLALKGLVWVDLRGTRVSDEGTKNLAAGNPALQIIWSGGTIEPKSAMAAWEQAVAALPAEAQVAAVIARLKEFNRGFDGILQHEVQEGVVTGVVIPRPSADLVVDLAPLRALPGLKAVYCQHAERLSDVSALQDLKLTSLKLTTSRVTDLSPLKDMPLQELDLWVTPVSDLSPLKDNRTLAVLNLNMTLVTDLSALSGTNLTELSFSRTRVSDLSPLSGLKLTALRFSETPVSSLAPLKGLPLTVLNCQETKVTDLSPLRGMSLKELWCDFEATRDTEILRSLRTLEKINGKPAAEFWKTETPSPES